MLMKLHHSDKHKTTTLHHNLKLKMTTPISRGKLTDESLSHSQVLIKENNFGNGSLTNLFFSFRTGSKWGVVNSPNLLLYEGFPQRQD